jgi:hypothetical protein
MIKKEHHTQAIVGMITVCIVLLINISGCTSKQNTNESNMDLSGTWVGNVNMPMFTGRGNASISQITFANNNAEITLESNQGSFSVNYTFTMNGNTLLLGPTFHNRSGFPGQPSQNRTQPWNDTVRPPMNETWPTNGTRPGNWTRPQNGTWNSGVGRPELSISFSYSFNENHTVLYLNGAAFNKIK